LAVVGRRNSLNRHSSAHDQWIAPGCLMQDQRKDETPMKTSVRLHSMRKGKAATLLIASALAMGLSSVPAKAMCSADEWSVCLATHVFYGGAATAMCVAMCAAIQHVDPSGSGNPGENLGPAKKASAPPSVGYGSDPKKGFGDYTPVTLPPDRRPPSGTSTGIPTRTGARPTIPPPQYFRPR
jgi:hypothetical protein